MESQRTPRRYLVGVAVVGLVVSGAVGPVSAAPDTGSGPGGGTAAMDDSTGTARPAEGEWITLVTGDRLLVERKPTGDRLVVAQPGTGREGTPFRGFTQRGDLFVLPSDAEPAIGAGTVDSRLFNVSKLLDFGYADRARGDVPLLVSRADTDRTVLRGLVGAAGARVIRELPSVRAEAVRTEKSTAADLWRALRGEPAQRRLATGISRIALDGPVRATLDTSVPQIGAPTAWQAGQTGRGTTVAVLDTGVDATHPDLADAVVQAVDFTNSASGATDRRGHGTHVASIITGNGAASGGRYVGVAPDARILNGKVLDDNGSGAESDIIAGMEWAVGQGADVVNMSLGGWRGDGTDPLDQAVNRLSAQSDTLFVISAGNSGPGDRTVNTPGTADAALTVGAVSRQDELAGFSSRGPRSGNHAIKPDITAPGVDIVAARASAATIGQPVGDRYLRLSGTSMAAPHVAGAAAVVAGQRPELDGERVKAVLMSTARPKAGLTVYEQGTGRVDVARATGPGVYAEPATINNGFVAWPHHDDTPITRTITYRNSADAPLTLDLTVDVRDPAGRAAPAGLFTLDRSQVTVPAGGSASVELVTDTRVTGPGGRYGGLVLATGADGLGVRTPVAMEVEPESYDLTVKVLDHRGRPTADSEVRLVSLDDPEGSYYAGHTETGTDVVRVPRGRYYLDGHIATDRHDLTILRETMLIEPTFLVEGSRTLTFDARDGRPVGAVVDRPTARAFSTEVRAERLPDWSTFPLVSEYFTPNASRVLVRPSTSTAPDGKFRFQVEQRLGEPGSTGTMRNSPYLYHLRIRQVDGVAAERLLPQVHDADLGVVHTQIAAAHPGMIMGREDPPVPYTLPARITEYYTPDVPWSIWMHHLPADNPSIVRGSLSSSTPQTFQRGRPVVRRWNVAVFGPTLATGGTAVGRRGDDILVDVDAYADQSALHGGSYLRGTATLLLRRDGTLVGESPYGSRGEFAVPPEAATYRLESTTDRRSDAEFSNRVNTVWTFRSARTSEAETTALPLMMVRFAPALDEQNRAPAGAFSLPVYVQQQSGATYGSLSTLTVDVSYDGGTTWHAAPLTGEGLRRVAQLTHPAGTGFVSLRSTATDSAGNSVQQTIINAYRR